MSEQVLADVTRDGATQFTGIPVELFFETFLEQHGSGGIKPYYKYLCIVNQVIDIHQNDYLVNVRRIDPLTGQLVAMVDASGAVNAIQVISKPERFVDAHIEFRGDDARITGFA
jgi:hypothetical protein